MPLNYIYMKAVGGGGGGGGDDNDVVEENEEQWSGNVRAYKFVFITMLKHSPSNTNGSNHIFLKRL